MAFEVQRAVCGCESDCRRQFVANHLEPYEVQRGDFYPEASVKTDDCLTELARDMIHSRGFQDPIVEARCVSPPKLGRARVLECRGRCHEDPLGEQPEVSVAPGSAEHLADIRFSDFRCSRPAEQLSA